MNEVKIFNEAYQYAIENGFAISIDYGNFMSADYWDWITIFPEVTNYKVTESGISVDGCNEIPWSICSNFAVCPILGWNHTGVAVKVFKKN